MYLNPLTNLICLLYICNCDLFSFLFYRCRTIINLSLPVFNVFLPASHRDVLNDGEQKQRRNFRKFSVTSRTTIEFRWVLTTKYFISPSIFSSSSTSILNLLLLLLFSLSISFFIEFIVFRHSFVGASSTGHLFSINEMNSKHPFLQNSRPIIISQNHIYLEREVRKLCLFFNEHQ